MATKKVAKKTVKKIAKKAVKNAKGSGKMNMAKGIGAGIVAAGAAAAAGYYLYGSKNAKKNRKMIGKEIKADWEIVKTEAKRVAATEMPRAKAMGKKVISRGKKIAKKIAKKV